MEKINSSFKTLRSNIRKKADSINEYIFQYSRPLISNKKEICLFCYSPNDITKEHVLPKWVFENNPKLRAIASANQQQQSYNQITIPACKFCNNIILSNIEEYIIKTLKIISDTDIVDIDEIENIIRWLEILDYKLQVFDTRRKYIKHLNSDYDALWAEISLAEMNHFNETKPYKAFSDIKSSLNKITLKSKRKRINSLVIMDTKTSGLNFFNKPNEYIFIDLPTHNIALFYFLQKQYIDNSKAYNDATLIMRKVFNS